MVKNTPRQPYPVYNMINLIGERLKEVRARLEETCDKSGRDPASVRLLAVSKRKPVSDILQAISAGQLLFGENRVQEGEEKIPQVTEDAVRWHLIGPLQKNKAKKAAALFHMVESVDCLGLAQELDKRRGNLKKDPMPVLLQVNVAKEPQKFGFFPEEAISFLPDLAALPNLAIRGLMAIPPLHDDPEGSRPWFRLLADLRKRIADMNVPGVSMAELSMGMSHDYPVAIEEGATLVRVGSAIFGLRKPL